MFIRSLLTPVKIVLLYTQHTGEAPERGKKMTRYEEDITWRPSVEFIAASMILNGVVTADDAVEYFSCWWDNPGIYKVGEAPDVSHITIKDLRQAFKLALEKVEKTGKYPCLQDGEVIW